MLIIDVKQFFEALIYMKKSFLMMLLFCAAIAVKSQIVVNTSNAYLKLSDVQYNLEHLILINGIDSNTELEYTGMGIVEWRGSDGTMSTQNVIYPSDGVLYEIKVDGVLKYSVYVIDYLLYAPVFHSLTVIEDEDKCNTLDVELMSDIPSLVYKDRTGASRILPREFRLSYSDVAWKSETWEEEDKVEILQSTTNTINIKAPLQNTQFSLSGDQWAEQMGIVLDSIVSDEYIAVALETHVAGEVVERDNLNEQDRSSGQSIKGSGPLVVDFASNANPVEGLYYEWTYWNVKTPDAYTRYTDVDFRHTFRETGEYQVNLVVTSPGGCTYKDSLDVKVIESFIEVPNTFTPNGDGMNDEFRVAYKSIKTYSCVVKNRWGRTVFTSDDPGKGWNGKIGKADAAEGTYYYIIIAIGTDEFEGKPTRYKLAGDINLIR